MLPHLGTDKLLPVFRCVHIRAAAGTVTFDATDRYTMGRMVEKGTIDGSMDVLIELDDVKRILSTVKVPKTFGTSEPEVVIDLDETKGSLTLTWAFGEQSMSLRTADGEFPAIDTMFDEHPSREQGDKALLPAVHHWNPGYLARMAKANDSRSKHAPLVMHMPTKVGGPVRFTRGEQFVALVMTMRQP